MDAPKTSLTASHDLHDDRTAVDADLILQHKENIQPLASGRKVTALVGSLSVTPKKKDTRLATERAQLEADAEHAVDNDDDPLAAWIRYVDWTVDNYPQGISAESGLLELLERATRLFASDPRYKNDMRYLKLWIRYASYVDHPVKIFTYLNTNEIGTAYALLYEEYCNALERSGRREEAMEMYDIGIARRAHPLARLQARKKDFSVRMMSVFLPTADPPQLSSSQGNRSALGERKTLATRENAENRNPTLASSHRQDQIRAGNNCGAFQIYTEGEEDDPNGNPWTELESRDTHRKENYRSAVPAQGQILKQSIPDVTRTPRVEVYVDEAENPKTPARSNKEEAVFTLSTKKPGIDTLKRDPLRNYTMPSPETQTSVGSISLKESSHQSSGKVSASSSSPRLDGKPKTSTSLPSVKPNERLQIDISRLILPDGTEIHPLERRARDFGVADKKWPSPGPELAPNPAAANTGASMFRGGEIETRVEFEGTKPMTLTNNNFTNMTRDATVTINTKEALMAVYGMYNSPTKSITSDKAFAAMMDPRNADIPTPMPASAHPIHDENAGTAKKPGFKPFLDEATPGPSRIANENQRTPGIIFQTPGASRGFSTGKRTLSLKQALQPAQSFKEEDEDEEDYEPVTPAPVRHAKPLAIIPFMDEEPKLSPKPSLNVGSSSSKRGYEVGPRQEEDIFFVDPRAKVKLQPPPRSPEPAPGLPPGIIDEDNEGAWDEVAHDDYEQDEEEVEVDGGDEEFVEDEEAEYPHRWAPALTPITERTYEHTGNSKMWTTPLSVRDKSVMDTPFEASRAFREAEKLAAELREDDTQENGFSRREDHSESHSSWEDVGQEEGEPVVIDPYIRKSISQLVDRLAVPPNHHDLRPETCGQLEKLQKFVGPKGKATIPTPRRESANGYSLKLDGHKYKVHRKLGEGGYGAVFLADDIGVLDQEQDESGVESAPVAIKVVKPATVWESVILHRIHRKVPESVRPSLIAPRRLYIYQDESYHILNYSNHGTLLQAVNKASDLHVGSGIGGAASTIPGMDEMLVMFFTVELLKTLEGLHCAGFIHGDLKIDNCMVRLEEAPSWLPQYDPSGANGWSSKGILLIDFGRAIDTSLYPRGTSFVTDWKMDKRDCLEMREGRPWTYETDYYGLAGIIFCMLFGKYMELPIVKDGVQKLPASLKRYWKTAMWERLFNALLNPSSLGQPLPIVEELRDIRQQMEGWLVENGNRTTRAATLRALVKRLEMLSV